ncbi:MAG: ferrochelatase [Thermodesulfovibrionales bacterium]|nr:ferrochelatase [Thermodesulfovibrionales bacterium]
MGKNPNTIGVVFLNLGGPDSLQAVGPFLYNLFSDRQIIRLGPSFLQKPLAWLISSVRSGKTENLYRMIGGKSPILEITSAQAKALEESLNQNSSPTAPPPRREKSSKAATDVNYKVFIAMRYWHPFTEDVIPVIHNTGIRKLIALCLYPHYSIATSGSSLSKFREVISQYPIEFFTIAEWYDHPLYIESLIDVIQKGIQSFGSESAHDIHVLFSAHSLPQKFIDQGDPYVAHTMKTIGEITKRISMQWHLSYQSKSGPVQWLEPSTEAKLEELSGKGVKNILMVPISFVSDHIETLYEIDILYANLATKLGMTLHRAASLNTNPLFIEALRDMVMKSVTDLRWLPS